MGCSPPGSSAHGTLQARALQWVATSFSFHPFNSRDFGPLELCLLVEYHQNSPVFPKKIHVPLFAFFLCACPGQLSAFELTKHFRHWGVNEVPGDVWESSLLGFSWLGWATIWIWFYKEVSPLRTWWFSFSCLNNTAWRMAPWWD